MTHPRPPSTRIDRDRGDTLHGRWFADPYGWLAQLDDPEVRAWIAAQAVTRVRAPECTKFGLLDLPR